MLWVLIPFPKGGTIRRIVTVLERRKTIDDGGTIDVCEGINGRVLGLKEGGAGRY